MQLNRKKKKVKDGQKTKRDISLKKTHRWLTHEKILSITNCKRNTSQNYIEISPHNCQNSHHQKIYICTAINVGEDVEKREPSCTAGRI